MGDTAVSALPLNGTTLVSGVAIPAPTAYLSLAPLLLFLFGDSSSGTSSTCRGSGGIRRGGTTSTTKIHSPRGCCSCRGHGVVRGKGALRACAHPSRVHPSAGLPFPDKFSNALGLVSGQIDHNRMDARGIRKVLGPVSAAGTAPCKGSVRGWGTYGSSVSHDLGTVVRSLHFANV